MKQTGYTLVELLIVIFIISITASVAFISFSRNENQQLVSFARELTQLITLAEEQAILQPAVLGLTMTAQTLQFSSLNLAESDKKNEWQALDDHVFAKRRIPSDIQVEVKINDKIIHADDQPQIIISMNGEVTPFTIYLSKKGDKPRFAITGEADGTVENESLS